MDNDTPHSVATRPAGRGRPTPLETAEGQAEGPSRRDAIALREALFERAEESGPRRRLLTRLRTSADPLVERYWRLLATVNGWSPSSTLAPVHSRSAGVVA
ncbi:hypothetical protein [Streptomyces sp. NBC_01565]|uniref:hypothetical protein n=1 Tax=unclassified Streptomyces TaxID=2593676 RepID=UPI0022519519|nr:hypothetical protein [Streptomyces sp. NBC_01565]MCX4546360.1 hypothetical protein [Streptomyces sp. NBC_01565]